MRRLEAELRRIALLLTKTTCSQRVAQDRRDGTPAGNVPVAHGQDTRSAQPGAPRDLVGHIVGIARGGARKRHCTGLIVDRAWNSRVDVDQQRLDRAESRRPCDFGGVGERAPVRGPLTVELLNVAQLRRVEVVKTARVLAPS